MTKTHFFYLVRSPNTFAFSRREEVGSVSPEIVEESDSR